MWNFEVNYYSKVGKFANFAAQRRFEKEVHEKVSKLGSLADAEVSRAPRPRTQKTAVDDRVCSR